MSATPTSRTLRRLRDDGWLAEKVEYWNTYARRRHDLFGFVDVLAVRGRETLAIQATSRTNMAARRRKILGSQSFPWLLEAGWIVEVWGWDRNPFGRWRLKVERITG